MPVSPSELFYNQVAQGIRSFDELDALHESVNAEESRLLLDPLIGAVLQAHPLPDEVAEAIEHAQLKPTHTPCVLLRQRPIPEALAAIRQLPKDEMRKAFRLLTALLGIADARRRAACAVACQHWWHQDLRNPEVVEHLLRPAPGSVA